MSKDYVANTVDRLTKTDPNYGSQSHQSDYVDRIRRMQVEHHCQQNHDSDDPPEHLYAHVQDRDGKIVRRACYPFHQCCQSLGVHFGKCTGNPRTTR